MDFSGEPMNTMEILKIVHLTLELTPFSGIKPSIALMCRGREKENLGEFCENQQYNCEILAFFPAYSVVVLLCFVLFCNEKSSTHLYL